LRGGWDTGPDESEEGCPGGVEGSDDAGAEEAAALFGGGNCDFDLASGGADGRGDGGAGLSATLFVGGNCGFDPA
jgi:hypothetical protein